MHPDNHGWGFSRKTGTPTWRTKNFRSAIQRLIPFAQRFHLVQIEALPYQQILDKYDSPDTLFYLDPPYSATSTRFYGKTKAGNDYYNVEWNDASDVELCERVQKLEGKAIISYYPCELLDGLYSEWRREQYVVDAFGEDATELLLFNYEGACV